MWLAWLAYWVVAAQRGKAIARQENIGSRLLHHTPLIAGGVLLGWPALLGPEWEQRFHAHTFGWFSLGLALVVLGLGFAVTAHVWLGGNWSGRVTVEERFMRAQFGEAYARYRTRVKALVPYLF